MMNTKNILFILLLPTITLSQIQYGGTPVNALEFEEINFITVDHSQLINYELHPLVLKYADEYSVDINVTQLATKIDGSYESTFYLGIESPGAKALAFVFDEFNLTENTRMFIYDAEKSMHIGSFNSKNNNPSGSLSTAVIKGDQVVIELTIPNRELSDLKLHMSIVTHDFLDIMKFHSDDSSDRVDCNDNVACSSANNWGDQVNAVVLVSGNGGLCSAAIVNNTANDLTPYILYAAHCNSGGSSTVYFNYQANTCNGNSPGSYNTMSGTQNLAVGSFSNNDYALIKLYNNIPSSYGAYYAGWSRSSSSPGNNVVGIHHPSGDIKKISYDAYGMGSSGNWWDFAYSSGRVIPGSSGSPFFDSNKRIRGMASYIYTDYCSPSPDCYCSQNYYHGYAKFSSAWTYIDDYLDPMNTGTYTLDGTYDTPIVWGCTDSGACNYDSNATDNDGSCDYGITCWDGSDECSYSDCPPEPDPVTLSFGMLYNGSFEIVIDAPVPVAGFQFVISDYPEDISLTGAGGGSAGDNDFSVSSSPAGQVIGFSLTGTTIPVGQWVLTNLTYSGGSNMPQLCLSDGIVSDADGEGIPVQYGDCVTLTGSAQLSFGVVGPGTAEIVLNSTVAVAGFQFLISDSPDDLDIIGASGGTSGDFDFQVSTSTNGTILGFSLDGSTIPAGEDVLTVVSLSGTGSPELCMTEGIISDANGDGLAVDYGNCVTALLFILGDLNGDGIHNILDIVILVNIILGYAEENPAGDLNMDGIYNVLDIVQLVNIILA